MGASSFSITIDGYPATEIAGHSAPTWETLADGGCGEATWTFVIAPKTRHHALRPRALAVIKCGTHPVFTGEMTDMDRITGECHAYGLASSLRGRLALDSGGANTRDIGVAVAQAIADGWPGTNPEGITGTVAGDATGNPVTVGQLLDEYAQQVGMRWGVDGAGRLYLRADPTTHSWLASPGTAAFGVTDEDTPTRFAGRFDTGAGYDTAYAGVAGLDEAVDLTDRGAMSLANAEAILAGMLTRRGEVAWTNGVTLSSGQLMNSGGTPAFLPSVVAGTAMLTLGIGHMLPSGPLRNVVIGRARQTAGDPFIQIEPTNTARRTARAVWAA